MYTNLTKRVFRKFLRRIVTINAIQSPMCIDLTNIQY